MGKSLYPTPTIVANDLGWLDVSAALAWKMTRDGSSVVSQATGVAVEVLLDMISGKRSFNRAVLRYLGMRRMSRYRYQRKETSS